MLEIAYAQLRFAASVVFGIPFNLRSLDRLIDGLLATQHEFGSINTEATELFGGPTLDEATRREVQLRRFRTQADRAARETAYYGRLFEQLALAPIRLSYEDISRLPLTSKEAVRGNPGAFVCRSARPVFRTTTTGTTGRPTSICFSAEEIQTYIALTAVGLLVCQIIGPADIVQINTSSRATLGNICFAGACARLGALVCPVGLVEPEHTLALLTEKHRLPGKKSQTSVLATYPSYLGELVECGLRLGYRPGDFGLERICIGGELVTSGLKARCRELFGPVEFIEGYGMTEPWPFGGTVCSEGHLHFEMAHGLLELLNPETWTPVQPGQVGSLVLTPFPPFRQTTLLLRYDTQDMVQAMSDPSTLRLGSGEPSPSGRPPDGRTNPLTCSLRHLPATGNLLGKRHLSVQHGNGWTYPRQVLEALEAVEAVPLPARFGFWAVRGGVALEVVVRQKAIGVRRQLERSLAGQGVPVQELRLLTDRSQLRRPFPLRGDLREGAFDALSVPQAQPNGRDLLIDQNILSASALAGLAA